MSNPNNPRYSAENKRIIKIGGSLAISLDQYQLTVPADQRFKIGDMVYIRIAKPEKQFTGTTRVNTYGNTYIIYLNSRWGFKASDLVNITVEKMTQ